MIGHYRALRFYSPLLDSAALRLSMADDRGAEYFAIVAAPGGSAGRAAKERALDAIVGAIMAGDDPGEVRLA